MLLNQEVYYYTNDYEGIPQGLHECTVYDIREDGTANFKSEYHEVMGSCIRDSSNTWLIHNGNGYGVMDTTKESTPYLFFLMGNSVRIEDLPCDDEVRLMLALKYVFHMTSHNGMHWYS